MRCWRKVLGGLRVCALLAVTACQSGPPPVPEVVVPEVTAQQLVALLQARADGTRSAKGLFSAKIKGPGLLLPARVDGTVFYHQPDAMRVRGFTFFGGELFELVVNQDQFRLALPTEGRELKGHASELGRIAKFGRPVQLSLWAVHGALGLTTVTRSERLTVLEDGDRYRLEAVGAAGTEMEGVVRRLWFERKSLLMVQEEWVGPSGQVEATMRYEDFRPVSELVPASAPSSLPSVRPYRIVMEDGRGRGSVQLTMQELMANVPIAPDELGAI